MSNQMCHTEVMDCVLRLDSASSNTTGTDGETMGNFGFTLQGASFASDILMQPPIIGYLEPGGVAERYTDLRVTRSDERSWSSLFRCRSAVLQPGDRILAINGQQLEGMTLEDARSIIKESNNQIHLEIEFDVAGRSLNPSLRAVRSVLRLDSVMLSSGTCQVKILRKNLDLGLAVTCMFKSSAPIWTHSIQYVHLCRFSFVSIWRSPTDQWCQTWKYCLSLWHDSSWRSSSLDR